jgi:hypothetical protein
VTSPENIKPFVIGIIVLLVIYTILRARTERIRKRRNENPSRFRRNR